MVLVWDSHFSPLAVQHQAAQALNLAKLAAESYEFGFAGSCLHWSHVASERCYELILNAVDGLTDEEADLIEPAVTKLELQLFRLACDVLSRRDSSLN
jgi:hypothetical protein